VLEEIEELTNPKVKTGKKAVTQEQTQLKASRAGGAGRRARRVQQGRRGAPGVRAQEPPVEQQELITTLLAHTSLETSAPINLTMVGPTAGRCRRACARCCRVDRLPPHGPSSAARRHRLAKVLDRIHILEGRQLVLLNIDEVIRIIRAATSPRRR
jgi:topoisomerase-4 subunit A